MENFIFCAVIEKNLKAGCFYEDPMVQERQQVLGKELICKISASGYHSFNFS